MASPQFASVVALALGLIALGAASAAENGRRQVPPSLVFARHGDLYRMTIDGSEAVQLTRTKAAEAGPSVSPDSLTLAFTRGRDELWLMNLQGTEQQRLLAQRPSSVLGASTDSPTWSPGGLTIYAGRWARSCGSIVRVSVNGRGVVPKPTTHTSASWPAVSPDGQRIAISASDYCDPGWSGRLVVVDTSGRDTNDLRKFRSPPGFDVTPAWSPDGRRIAFVAWDYLESGRSALYVVSRDGSNLRRITQWTFETGGPAWSPDGQLIAFHKEGGLFLVRPNGSELKGVPGTLRDDASPSWLLRS